MPAPSFITFTGADDHTPHADLGAFGRQHPKTEFGILFSRDRSGQTRYPSKEWIEALPDELLLAAHICGSWASDLANNGGQPEVEALLGKFGRVQINIGRPPEDLGPLKRFGARHCVEIILQCRDPEVFPDAHDVSWLYDASGGRGIAPKGWPVHPGNRLVGYAGGLGPTTVRDVLDEIQASAPFWIDMESKVRSEEDLFDLELCSTVIAHSGL